MALSIIFMHISDVHWHPGSRVEFLWGDAFVCEPDWSWKIARQPNLDLWCVHDGVGWVRDGDRRTPIAAGDCLLLRRGAAYAAGQDPERPLRFIAVHFELRDGQGRALDPTPEELPPFIRRMEASGLFRDLLERAIDAHRDGRGDAASAWLQTAVLEMLREDGRTHPPGLLGEQADAIAAICERVRRHPGDAFRVDELARELHVSPAHFARLFKRFQGTSPRAFLTQTRIEAARALLLKSNHPIARISDLLGYEGPFYFSRQFKAKTGLAPSIYRSRKR